MHLSFPVLLDDQIDIRCDRVTCENKGGGFICVPSQMNPSNTLRFATNGIEAVSATIQLPNAVFPAGSISNRVLHVCWEGGGGVETLLDRL